MKEMNESYGALLIAYGNRPVLGQTGHIDRYGGRHQLMTDH